jgi:hypothetical protein
MAITLDGTNGINSSGVIVAPDGSASAPAITNDGDTNTGIFFPAADTAAISTGGSERMRIDTSGNVGIGTSSPSNKLHVSNAIQTGSNANSVGVLMGAAAFRQSIAGPLYFDAGSGSTAAGIIFRDGSGFAERMRIDTSGNLLVGRTSSGGYSANSVQISQGGSGSVFDVSSGTPIFVNRRTTTGDLITFSYNQNTVGTISTNGTGTTYGTSSDYRLKENIAPMTGALATVAQLNPVTYNWKSDGSAGQGFIAHELQEVVPDCVTGEKDAVDAEGNPQYQGIDTSFLVATLTAAIQEQQTIIDSLKARIEALENNNV